MNTSEISKTLKSIPKLSDIFAGFSFPDKSAPIDQFPSFTIINTDLSSGPGEHWCVAFFDKNKNCDYFDPLGIPPQLLVNDLTHILNQFNTPYSFTTHPVQSENTKTCGPHCIYFSFLKSCNLSFKHILQHFYDVENTQCNDSVVVNFMINNGFPFNPR